MFGDFGWPAGRWNGVKIGKLVDSLCEREENEGDGDVD